MSAIYFGWFGGVDGRCPPTQALPKRGREEMEVGLFIGVFVAEAGEAVEEAGAEGGGAGGVAVIGFGA